MIAQFRAPASFILIGFTTTVLAVGCSAETDDELTGSTEAAATTAGRHETRTLRCTFHSRTRVTTRLASSCNACKVTVMEIALGSLARGSEYYVSPGTYTGTVAGKACVPCAESTLRSLEGLGGDCEITSTTTSEAPTR